MEEGIKESDIIKKRAIKVKTID